jgi:hypothetical protein
VPYKLSDAEAQLYKEVTDYVREEFNRAEALQNDKRAGTVGFALTILQRRLASSPEAIYQSLRRRRERLESAARDGSAAARRRYARRSRLTPILDADDVEDLEEAPDNEVEAVEERSSTRPPPRARSQELKAEIATLKRARGLANAVRRSGEDTQVARAGQPARRDLHARGHRRTRRRTKAPYGAGADPEACQGVAPNRSW